MYNYCQILGAALSLTASLRKFGVRFEDVTTELLTVLLLAGSFDTRKQGPAELHLPLRDTEENRVWQVSNGERYAQAKLVTMPSVKFLVKIEANGSHFLNFLFLVTQPLH